LLFLYSWNASRGSLECASSLGPLEIRSRSGWGLSSTLGFLHSASSMAWSGISFF
ncbi:hypothetical protein LINPERHAP2_LOCUS7611, partial [Linum perenne]